MLDETTVNGLVADATAAPSMHNAQPWRFHYAPDSRTLALSADLDRALPSSDPTLAGLHLGCGAALLNLRVAAVHRALRPETALLPDPRDPSLLATVRLESATTGTATATATGTEAQDDGLRALHPAIHDRHTSRQPFTDQDLPEEVRRALADAARQEGAELTFLTGPHLQFVLDLIQDAEGYNRMSPGREAELRQWTWNAASDSSADGVPDYAFGPRKGGGGAPVRDFAGTGVVPGRTVADFEDRPHLFLLSTPEDGPADWLRAGQAMERVLLLATLHGVSGTPATQALEHPELRWLLRDPVSGTGHVQMVLRLGYGPRGPRTPRRPVGDVLTIGD
ncbi:nitroreductase [Streptomyces sp. GMY02]|uniref:Acg family FMN-binding oxidoreductase n=1 Tax=Streptomyces sp. GMY02 TaxID=1333528 RepID=UPI0020B6A83C|nr:nitroreductase [Streptomyces sp. GMY02]